MQTTLYTIAEVAAILHTNVTYVHRLRKAQLLPCIKLGCYKVRSVDLYSFLEKYVGYDLTNPEKIRSLVDVDEAKHTDFYM